ncbi:MAG: hypothetical protein F6K41_15580 [Symploca sp. SIO3E6]|nr:hypothetical protein [Caldora sp. SIO3E6]
MEPLEIQIKQKLISYQKQVDKKLYEFRRQGLISSTELEKIKIDVEITGQAVVEGLASQEQYTAEAVEIYVFSLLEKYKNKIEHIIRPIEEKQKSSEILIKGKKIPVYFEDEQGQLILPSQIEKEISLIFLENTLENPVKSIKIVIGNLLRKIDLIPEESQGLFNNKTYQVRAKEENQRMQNIYKHFGGAISQLVNSDYPEEVKELNKSKLLEKMQNRLVENNKREKKATKQSFWPSFFGGGNKVRKEKIRKNH